MSLTDDAHQLIRDHFKDKNKNLAIDATCGNGHDTQFLAELGFKKVIGFDVQECAIEASSNRIKQLNIQGAEFILAGHETMENYVHDSVDCVMFNFGYLPSGDKSRTTNAKNSIKAIEAATRLLENSGLISLMCYPGHPNGKLETQVIVDWFKTLKHEWIVETHLAVSPKPTAPILYTVKRAG